MASYLSTDLTSEDIEDFFRIKPKAKPRADQIINRSSNRVAQGSNLIHSDAKLNRTDKLPEEFIPPYKRHSQRSANQVAYASYYQQEEDELLTRQVSSLQLVDDDSHSALSQTSTVRGGMEDIDMSSMADSAPCLGDDRRDEDNAVYTAYNMRHKYDPNLPITQSRQEIINTIEANQVTVIEGPTGSGKTTQVPQYILDHCAAQNKYCNIVVTQPRRIAAVSIARRVCTERNWDLRGLCGYQIGMDRQASEDTRLLYVTTQVLLRQLISAKSMQQFTHIILDEVHERDQHSDFCLLIVRKLLRTNSRDVKVILMSATIETSRFADYFKVPVRGIMEPAPVLTVGATTFNVSEYFVEDLTQLGPIPMLEPDRPGIATEALELAKNLIMEFDQLEIKQQGESPNGFAAKRGSVLVFLPGLREISDMDEALDKAKHRCQLEVLPLHSTITADEQARVFESIMPPKRKVILSTNIAESSITVTDIKYVIDFCLTKNMVCDSEMYTSLNVEWASKANCVQRKGRAGRVSNGRVYRMVTRRFYAEMLPEYGTPEMQRCSLEHLVLQVKLLDLGEPKKILGLALSPPNLDDIERTILTLKEAGALTTPPGELYNPHDGQLTFMGHVLAELPVDIHFGKLMMLGHVFGVLEQCVIIAAMLSLKSVFQRPFKAELESYKMKLTWASDSCSDCIAMLKVYRMWEQKHQLNAFPGRREERDWGRKHMVQITRLYEVRELVRELGQRLSSKFNIRPPRGPPLNLDNAEETLILQVVMAGAFYPNYFVRVHNEESEELANRALSGRNLYTTVVVKNLPPNEGTLYRNAIQQLFKPCHPNPRIHFEESKAFVEFPKDPTHKSKQFSPSVFLALKMRQLRIPLNVYLLDREEAFQRKVQISRSQEKTAAAQQQLRTNRISMIGGSSSAPQSEHQVQLPSHDKTVIELNITEVIECGRFWAHYGDEETWQNLCRLQEEINKESGRSLKPLSNPQPDTYCLCPFEGEYYRARIVSVTNDMQKGTFVRVFFVDYGNVSIIALSLVRQLAPHHRQLKFQSFECELCGLRPSPRRCPSGKWTEEAKNQFERAITSGQKAYGKVYSVVHGVVRLELQIEGPGQIVKLNKFLIEQDFADNAEESFLSKQDHADREDVRVSHNLVNQPGYVNGSNSWLPVSVDNMAGGPTSDMRPKHKFATSSQRLTLSGPNSPYEMNFFGLTSISRLRTVNIDQDSVNSIVLDDKPEDPHMRMLVAAGVTLNPSGNKIKLRDTSLLPHIPGLPALLTLLFTPQAELRTDLRQRRYTGALCGLGWDSFNHGPALPDHDVEMTFDTYIDKHDIVKINAVRIAINVAIGNEEDLQYWGPNAVIKTQKKARDNVLELLQRKRERMDPVYFKYANQWNRVKPEDLLSASIGDGFEQQQNDLYGLHPLVALVEDDTMSDVTAFGNADRARKEEKYKMLQHIEYLRGKATESSWAEPVECLLCNFKLETLVLLKMHLATRMHKEQETTYLV